MNESDKFHQPAGRLLRWLFLFLAMNTSLAAMNAQPTATPVNPLAGTWELRRAEILQADGTHAPDPYYGADARGVLIVDADGRYSLQIFRRDRPKFAAGDKAKGTPEEYKSALLGMSTHAGTVAVDETRHQLRFHIELAAFPNWEGAEQARDYELAGDELSYAVPPRPGGTKAVSVWHRTRR